MSCVVCPDEQPPCPSCEENEICGLVQASCEKCASTICVDGTTAINGPNFPGNSSGTAEPVETFEPTVTATPSASSISPGALAGAVVGGVIFVLLVTVLITLYVRRRYRWKREEEPYPEIQHPELPELDAVQPSTNEPVFHDLNATKNIKPTGPTLEESPKEKDGESLKELNGGRRTPGP